MRGEAPGPEPFDRAELASPTIRLHGRCRRCGYALPDKPLWWIDLNHDYDPPQRAFLCAACAAAVHLDIWRLP